MTEPMHFMDLKHGFLVAALGLTAGSGCQRAADGQGHAHDHGHSHEAVTAQITVWTNGYEVFAEHPAPAAGSAVTFITHVTHLRTAAPREEGGVTWILRRGETVVEQQQASPDRPGIYLPELTFPEPGPWQISLLIPSAEGNVTVRLGTITVHADEHEADHADFPDAPEGITFLKEQQWRIGLRTAPAARRPLIDRLPVPAHVRSRPGTAVSVVAPVAGNLVSLEPSQVPGLGASVQEGQPLARLVPNQPGTAATLAQARADLGVATAELGQAEAAYERVKALAAQGAKSERELQEAAAAYASARARHAAASSLLRSLHRSDPEPGNEEAFFIELQAPLSGVINSVSAGPGDSIAAGQTILNILDRRVLWIEGHVPEADLSRLGSAGEAVMELSSRPGRFVPVTGGGRGSFVSLGLEIEAATRTVPIVYEMENPEGELRIGQHVTLHVETSRVEEALAVPESALVEEGERLVAYVQLSGETFEKRDLKVGIRDAGQVQVLEGIAAGERVVTEGAYPLRLSSLTGAIPEHGHVH